MNQDRHAGETVYHKIDFIHRHKKQILSLAGSSGKRNAVPTKRNPRRANVAVPSEVRVVIRTKEIRARVRQITVDEIGSFALVSKIRSAGYLGDALSEDQVKEGFRRILGERGQFRDWGGEQHDLYTTLLRVGGKRRSTAIAFKGPGAKGKLTPKKMGKNGDQIQRLMESPAEVFLIQYGGQIDPSIVTQMQQLALARSLAGGVVLFGTIDGADSLRLVKAYSAKFKSRPSKKK